MNLPPETVSIREIASECQKTALKWPSDSLGLAVLIGDDGVATKYLVGGPIAAQIFAQMGLKADLKPDDMAVPVAEIPTPLEAAPPLAKIGYLIICYGWEEFPLTALLVILTRERARVLQSLKVEMLGNLYHPRV